MKLMVQPYTSGSAYNMETEETAFLHYAPTHGFDNPAEVTVILSDPIGLIAQKYVNSSGAVGGAVADDGGVETDETTEANENTADDMTLLPAAPANNDAYYFGFSRTFQNIQLNVSTAATTSGGGWTIVWEYSTGADAWTALSGVTDGTTNYFTAGVNTVDWTIPTDWATDEVGAISGLYWVRGRATIVIAGTTSPKGKQAWIEGVYVGPGKVTIEDPTATDMFYGRIMKAEANTASRTVTLYCQDWLSQLDEEQITYDMREKLSGDIRQGTGHADPDGAFVDVAENDAGTYYFYDDAMAWANDAYNGKYLILSNGMAGKIKVKTGPYSDTITWHGGTHTDAGDFTDVWVDDANFFTAFDADADFEVDLEFRAYVGHNTPSNFYVHDSISGARIYWSGVCYSTTNTGEVHPEIWTGAAYQRIGGPISERGAGRRSITLTIPDEYISSIVDANGIVKIRFAAEHNGELTVVTTHHMKFEVDVETTGYSSAITINDTITTNKLEIATDLTAAATRVWETIPYCIAKKIYLHIESATGPILGGDSMVTLTCAAGNVENTSGISTRQYVGKTRLEVAKDLAVQDRAHFWIALGGTTVTWKSTFNDGAPETLTDTDINSITSTFDYSTLVNETTVYGMRIGDERLSSTYTDATSEAKYKQTRTKVTSDTGLVSEYDTLARATAITNQYKDVQQILTCTIRGNTATAAHDKTLVLGDEVSITSTYLGLTAAVYIVQRFSYDSKNNLTNLLLHPRVSAIGLQKDERPSFEQVMQANRRGTADPYIAAPDTNEVA